MNLIIKIIIIFSTLILNNCANYEYSKSKKIGEKKTYSSSGFALIYDDNFFIEGIIDKKLSNDNFKVTHSFLKRNTPIKIINPVNQKSFDTKIEKNANYPKIFNIVISNKIAQILELDQNNPFVEIIEIKKNVTFVAGETKMFEEEKKVADTAPVSEVTMDNLLPTKSEVEKKITFLIIISDFYYQNSADNLKNELIKQTKINNFSVKKIGDNKYRLMSGPFKNFNALKATYISLNNLGFEELNVYIN